MINKEKLENLGLKFVDEYFYDDTHHSFVLKKDDICVIVDDNICETDKETIFDYSKYCEMQNKYMAEFQKLYRFNYVDNSCYDKIKEWLNKTVEDIEVKDDGGSFDVAHTDNTPLEKTFEDLFVDTYGDNATEYLKKEYPVSLANGRNAFVDYVIETKNGNFAIEENGAHYHHPCIIGNKAYDRQLEKQNTLNLYSFKVFRFSIQNLTFREQAIDNIKTYLGDKKNFINSVVVKQERMFKLYEHQEQILDDLHESRQEGINTALIVIPTGTGKSQIVIEDIKDLAKENEIHNVLIMVPTTTLKNDWKKRVENLDKSLNIEIKFYNTVFQEKNSLDKSYYDYIVFDEAHHAQAANCKKTLQYFTPKYLIGLTATPERLDRKKLDEIFGEYESKLTLREAIEKGVISNIRCYRLISNIDLSEVRYNGKDYNYADLEKTLLLTLAMNLLLKLLKNTFLLKKIFINKALFFV